MGLLERILGVPPEEEEEEGGIDYLLDAYEELQAQIKDEIISLCPEEARSLAAGARVVSPTIDPDVSRAFAEVLEDGELFAEYSSVRESVIVARVFETENYFVVHQRDLVDQQRDRVVIIKKDPERQVAPEKLEALVRGLVRGEVRPVGRRQG